jgi:hypothetical protein
MSDALWFERLAEATGEPPTEPAPATLKSRTYSAVVARMAQASPLLDLRKTRAAGGRLCVFETALTVPPLGPIAGTMNPCRICHARVLGERMEHAPIFWPGCPYADFHGD